MGQTSKITPHPTPLDEDLIDGLRLIRSRRVGPTTFHRLMVEYGSAQAALAALPHIAQAAGVRDYTVFARQDALNELAAGRRFGAVPLYWDQAEYPQTLRDIPDAPPFLWAKGDVSLLHRITVALVGARNASSLGERMTRKLAEGLGQAGLCIVSGLARGIDAEAHSAALDTGTVAVMAGGIDVIYPNENISLAEKIVQKGCLISEQPMGTRPLPRHFPLRNRIVSGLSRAVVVVEATARSGSLITARLALEQGRDVLAVPGHPFDARAFGCLALLRDGANMVRGAADVLEVLGIAESVAQMPSAPPINHLPPPQPEQRALSEVAALHDRILSRLSASPIAEDHLIRDLGVSASAVSAQLFTLELDGKVNRAAGGMVSRVD